MTHTGPWPHEGGCRGCWRDQRCNVCGILRARRFLCTNGRCAACHGTVCRPGGNFDPGHGYGDMERARARVAGKETP